MLVVNVREVSLISLHEEKTDTLSDFMARQADKCSEAAKKLVVLRESIISVVVKALKVQHTHTHTYIHLFDIRCIIFSCSIESMSEKRKECMKWTRMGLHKSQKVCTNYGTPFNLDHPF